jgi:hypothetical protein
VKNSSSKENKMPWDDDFEAYASNRKSKKRTKENCIMLQIGDYAWSNKGCRTQGPTGGRILEFTTHGGRKAARIRKADKSVRTFLLSNLTKIHRRTFERRTGVSSLPMKVKK